MVGAHKAVTLRGSTRLKDVVIVEQEHLTLAGNIEISAGDGEVWAGSIEEMLDDSTSARYAQTHSRCSWSILLFL
jgi:hypothetical protein